MGTFISDGKILHCKRVAEIMYLIARDCCKFDEQTCKEMYALGLVHDIGYLNIDDYSEHPAEGAAMLPGYRYANIIMEHGEPDDACQSVAKKLLQFADMHVNPKGEIIPMMTRLCDIGDRYGVGSLEYNKAEKICNSHYDGSWFLFMSSYYFV